MYFFKNNFLVFRKKKLKKPFRNKKGELFLSLFFIFLLLSQFNFQYINVLVGKLSSVSLKINHENLVEVLNKSSLDLFSHIIYILFVI